MIVTFFILFNHVLNLFKTRIFKYPLKDRCLKSDAIQLLDCLDFDGIAVINDEGNIQFMPPVFYQRYHAICDVLTQLRVVFEIKKVVDLGCSEIALFTHLKRLESIEEYIGVDIDSSTLEKSKCRVTPLNSDYLSKRCSPLKVMIFNGSAIEPDLSLKSADAVVAVELIEHMYPPELEDLPYNLFGIIQPDVVIFTTPNADFNILFNKKNDNQFRHFDHKFEWSRNQFEDWGNNLILRYPSYDVWFNGIGKGPDGTDAYGCCSQIAVFVRNEVKSISNEFSEFYKLICEVEYPHQTKEEKLHNILDYEVTQYIDHFYIENNGCIDKEKNKIPLVDILNYIDVPCTEENLKEFLDKSNKHVEYVKKQLVLVLPSDTDDNESLSSSPESVDFNNVKKYEEETWSIEDDTFINNEVQSNGESLRLSISDVNQEMNTNGNSLDSPTINDDVEDQSEENKKDNDKALSTPNIFQKEEDKSEYSKANIARIIHAQDVMECASSSNSKGIISEIEKDSLKLKYNIDYSNDANLKKSEGIDYEWPSPPQPSSENSEGKWLLENVPADQNIISFISLTSKVSESIKTGKLFCRNDECLPCGNEETFSKTIKKEVNELSTTCDSKEKGNSMEKHTAEIVNVSSRFINPSEINSLVINENEKTKELCNKHPLTGVVPSRCHSLEDVNMYSCKNKRFRYSLNIEHEQIDCDTEIIDMELDSGCNLSSIPSLTETSVSQSKAVDSGYPNSTEDMDLDLTPEQVDEIITETESSLEDEESSADERLEQILGNPPVVIEDNVENGDVVNNNRDDEGNNLEEGQVLIEDIVFEGVGLDGEELEAADEHESEDEGLFMSALDVSAATIVAEEQSSAEDTVYLFDLPSTSTFESVLLDGMNPQFPAMNEFPAWLLNMIAEDGHGSGDAGPDRNEDSSELVIDREGQVDLYPDDVRAAGEPDQP